MEKTVTLESLKAEADKLLIKDDATSVYILLDMAYTLGERNQIKKEMEKLNNNLK